MNEHEIMKAMAEDLQHLCGDCIEWETDDDGYEYPAKVCPFLEKDKEPQFANCVIGDPQTWHLERIK